MEREWTENDQQTKAWPSGNAKALKVISIFDRTTVRGPTGRARAVAIFKRRPSSGYPSGLVRSAWSLSGRWRIYWAGDSPFDFDFDFD